MGGKRLRGHQQTRRRADDKPGALNCDGDARSIQLVPASRVMSGDVNLPAEPAGDLAPADELREFHEALRNGTYWNNPQTERRHLAILEARRSHKSAAVPVQP